MKGHAFFQRTALAVTLVALGTACDEPVSKIPTVPGGGSASMTGVEITGPASVAPGQSVQFNASIRLSDGAVKIASPSTVRNWRIGNSFYLQVDQAGIVTAQPRVGETTLSVEVRVGTQTRTATREIVILPEGTYRLVGKITEAGLPTQAVGGARVEVAGGSASATSDFNGQYRIYGVPPSGVLRITATGYADLEQELSLTSHTTRNFQMDLFGPRPTIGGPYTLTLDVVSPCAELSSELQHRRYDAFVSQNGSTVEVELTEPRFRMNSHGRGNRFSGRTIGNGVTFTLRPYAIFAYYYWYYYYFYSGPTSYPDVAERLGNNTFLVIEGQATTSLTGSSLSGTFSGSLTNWDSQFPSVIRRLSSCNDTAHQFVLTPR